MIIFALQPLAPHGSTCLCQLALNLYTSYTDRAEVPMTESAYVGRLYIRVAIHLQSILDKQLLS